MTATPPKPTHGGLTYVDNILDWQNGYAAGYHVARVEMNKEQRRERAAIAAMQGILSTQIIPDSPTAPGAHAVAAHAISYADALIAKLSDAQEDA